MLGWKLRVVLKELVEGLHGVQKPSLIAGQLLQMEKGHEAWDAQLHVTAQTETESNLKAPS
jgi:hypothetical protein